MVAAWTKMLAVHRRVEDGFKWKQQDFLTEGEEKHAIKDYLLGF